MIRSINQIREEFKIIATQHKMINDFYYGYFYDAYNQNTIKHPLLVLNITQANKDRAQNNFVNLSLEITVCDKIHTDRSNENDVASDTLKILNDIHNTLQTKRWTRWSTIIGAAQQNYFREAGTDVVCGWVMHLTLQVADLRDVCAIPYREYDYEQEVFSTCAPVEVFKDGIFELTVPSGGRFDYASVAGDTVTVNVNGNFYALPSGGDTLNVLVRYQNGTPVGTIVAEVVEIPDIPNIDIRRSDNSLIASAPPPSYVVADSIVEVRDTDGDLLSTTNILADSGTQTITAPDAVYRNDSTSPTYTQNIKSGETFTAPNIVLTQPNGATENKLPNINLSCTQINALDNSDLVAQLLAAQIVAVYEGRISINVRQYTANDTYTKPSNLLFAHVIAVGGGGGGASGAKRPNGTSSSGGGGGGCGAVARAILQASEIGGTETITIGTGGNGGASVTTDNTAGNNGGNGGDTSFGSLVIAKGGLGAVGQAAGATVAFDLSTPNTNGLNIMGANGYGGGITGAGTNGLVMTPTSIGLYFGGSGGGGISNATPGTQNAGGARTRIYNASNTLSAAQAGGTAGGGNGANGINNYALQIGLHPTILHTIGLGVSGVGGGSANNGTTNGGNGGNGGLYGSGGGGGGAARDGTAQSGAGGNGAQGCLIIYEFLIV